MRKIKVLLVTLPLVFLFSCAPKVQENQVTVVEKKVLSAAYQAKGGNESGPITLSHRKLEINEISKHLEMDDETTIAHLKATNVHGYFSLIAKNYPPGAEFILYQIDMSRNVRPTKTFFVSGNGMLVTQLDDQYIYLANNFLFFSNYLPGEPVDFVLGSREGRYFAGTRIVPNPIQAEDESNRKITVQIDHPDKRHYLVHCTGFQPCETYMLITIFENEKLVHAVKANGNGEIFQATGPTVPWVTGGDGSLEIRGQELSRPLSVNFQWGL